MRCRGRSVAGAARRAPRPPPLQERLDKRFDLAVEHGAHVAGLVRGAEVLDHLVRREHVRPDLAPPADLALLARDRVAFLAALLPLTLGEARRVFGRGITLAELAAKLADFVAQAREGLVELDRL